MSIDRESRDRLAEAIVRYLDEDLTAFAFDELIFGIAEDSDDPTVFKVAHLLWHHYDDLKDHKVILSKQEWDYFQRLLLLLRSDASLETKARRVWSPRQPLAALALAVFALGGSWLGWGWQLLWVVVPLGGLSMLLAHWPGHPASQRSRRWAALTPFVSVSQMLALRRGATGFSKRRYPPHLDGRCLRGPATAWVVDLPARTAWLLLSPIVLLAQALPDKVSEDCVVTAGAP